MEAHLQILLRTLCAHVYADVAPPGVESPYVVWQGIGGESINALDNSAPGTRNTLMQVSVWAKSRLEATTLSRAIETALRGSASFTASPSGEPLSTYEPDTQLHGSIQRFSIWASG